MYMKIGKKLQYTFITKVMYMEIGKNLLYRFFNTVLYWQKPSRDICQFSCTSFRSTLLMQYVHEMYMKIGKISPYTNLL